MKKKNEVIEILKNGGHIMVDSIYRTARVYTGDGDEAGDSCRYDVAERLEKTPGYKKTFSRGWSLAWYITAEATEDAAQEPEKTAEEWAAESDAVQAATLAALAPVIATEPEEQPEPEETAQEKTDRENRETCQRIAEELELYAAGDAHKCPHCGEVFRFDDWEETEHDGEIYTDGTLYTCPHCGEEVDADDLEAVSIYDYFSDALDIEYRCNSNREYKSVSIMVTCGGPNIYIDTAEKAVLLYWWTDRARYYLSSAAVEAVDALAEEYWNL